MLSDLLALQTYGGTFATDGRLQGNMDVQTVNCDQSANTCSVQVPAPGFALVFLTSTAYSESNPSTTQTFSTSSYTRKHNTATIPASILATSNGHSGSTWQLSSTSKGSVSGAQAVAIPGVVALIAMEERPLRGTVLASPSRETAAKGAA